MKPSELSDPNAVITDDAILYTVNNYVGDRPLVRYVFAVVRRDETGAVLLPPVDDKAHPRRRLYATLLPYTVEHLERHDEGAIFERAKVAARRRLLGAEADEKYRVFSQAAEYRTEMPATGYDGFPVWDD